MSTDKNSDSNQKKLKNLEYLAQFLDAHFQIPFTTIRIGFDALIGLIPFFGDALGFTLSLALVFMIAQMGVSMPVLFRITLNSLFDFVIGLVPFVGDVADIYFKPNIKNVAIARRYLEKPGSVTKESRYLLWGLGFLILCFIVGSLALCIWLGLKLFHFLAH